MSEIKLRAYSGHVYLGTSHLSLCGKRLTFFNFTPEALKSVTCRECLQLLKQRQSLGLLPQEDGKPVKVLTLKETQNIERKKRM